MSYKKLQLTVSAILVCWILPTSLASATVISVETSGEYKVEEAKNFKQRQQENSQPLAKEISASLEYTSPPEPFIARIISAPNKTDLDVETQNRSQSLQTSTLSDLSLIHI